MYEDLNEIATLRFNKRREEISAFSRHTVQEMQREYAAINTAGVKSGPHEAAIGRAQIEGGEKTLRALSDIWQDLIERRNGRIARGDVDFIGQKLDAFARTQKGHLHQAFSMQRMGAVVNLLTEEADRRLQAEAASCRRDLTILARETELFSKASPVTQTSAQKAVSGAPSVQHPAEGSPAKPAIGSNGTTTTAILQAPTKSIGSHIWSWTVVGTVVVLAIGSGFTFMTSSHPRVADGFYIVSGILFLAKFLTWEETRQQVRARKIAWQLGATLLSAGLATVLVFWSHSINKPTPPPPPDQSKHAPDGQTGQVPQTAAPQLASPERVPATPDSAEPDHKLDRALIKFFSVRIPAAKRTGPCVPNNAHPYQCVDDAVLSQKLLEEATKIQTVTAKYPAATPTMIERQDFTSEIQKCCWKDMIDLRYAVFDRLGPSSQSKDEERAWEDLALYAKSPMKTLEPKQLTSYTRYLTDWGSTLRDSSEKTP